MSRARSPWLRRAALGALVLAALILIPYWTSWRYRRIVRGFVLGHARDVVRLMAEPEELTVSQRPRLVADFRAGRGGAPLVLLVHGSDPAGRKEGLCRLLADRLGARGLAVLALDLRGFGDSEDPALPWERPGEFEADVTAAARFALETGRARPGRIVYVGPSLGAGIALRAARAEPRPAGVAALGTPRTLDRFERGGEAWRRTFAAERFKDMGLAPDEPSLAAMGRYLVDLDVASGLDAAGLPPVLVVYGEHETLSDRVRRSAARHELRIVARADHRYRVTAAPFGIFFCDRSVLDELVSMLTAWIERTVES